MIFTGGIIKVGNGWLEQGSEIGEEIMGGMSRWHLIVVIAVLFVFPTVKILHKAGYSGWWCLLLFVPIVNWVMLWVFAHASWPNLRPEER